MLRRRHPNKSKKWLSQHYWSGPDGRNIFAVGEKTSKGDRVYSVIRLSTIGIRRHVKIRASANPYTQEDAYYFWQRRHKKESHYLPALSSKEFRRLWI